ncbi:MAG: ABC transporter ATP-binding protein [Phycisphaerales bacterium]|nr:ABC transporter ATP-binding protein [Phycisphaerales bacterium]
MTTRIGIAKLTKTFGRANRQVKAVNEVDLTIEPGEIFFLLGPSGCGKTTLLRMIAGFIQPTSGSIHFNDREITRLNPNKRNAGMVFQSYALWPHMTAIENVAFGLKVRKLDKEERLRRAKAAMEDVQLGHLADRKPGELSGGQQQRVALARALVIRPEVLLLDEPLSNLDARLRNDLREEIRRICKDAGITTVYVTHDQKEALSVADRIAVMRDGKVVQAGSPMELYRRPTTAFAASFLGETNLIEGELERGGTAGQIVELKTAMGVIPGTLVQAAESGARARVSIRPESLRTAQSGSISASIASTTYLGEVAHHRARHESGGELAISEFAPGPKSAFQGKISLSVAPDDAVILVD